MAEVTGTLGEQALELNNAATEATLKLILVGIKAANKDSAAAIDKIAKQAGIDPATVSKANEANEKSAGVAYRVGAVFGSLANAADRVIDTFDKYSPIVKTLTSGGTNVGTAMTQLGALIPGVGGKVVQALGAVAQMQEEYLGAYQKMTKAGINFGGSLTDMRMAASNTYMTLEQFGSLMKSNSETFAKMGGTAEQGAQAFVKVSNSLLKSEAGDSLRALGYTSAEVNEGLAGYLANTGARSKQDMQNTSAITKGAAEYLTQLDGLATITGKSREEQEKSLKAANANAAFEQMKMGMSEEQRAAYNAGMAEMSAKFGKAGEDLFKSQAMGLPPMTEAAQKLQALSPEVARASQGMADVGKRGGTMAETLKMSAQATAGASQAAERFKGVAGALSFSSDGTATAMMGLTKEANRARAQGTETAAAGEKQQQEIAQKQKERLASEAADAAEAGKALQEMGQVLMRVLMPVFKILAWTVNFVVGAISVPFKLLGSIIDKTVDLFKPLMPSLMKLVDAIGSVLSPIMDILKSFGGAVLDIMDIALTPLKITFGILLKVFEVGIDSISFIFEVLGKGLRMLSDTVGWVLSGFTKVADGIKSMLPSWLGGGDSKKPEGKAVGGPVNANKQYMVGEKGPELFTPGASGQITSNDKMKNALDKTIEQFGQAGAEIFKNAKSLPPMTQSAQASANASSVNDNKIADAQQRIAEQFGKTGEALFNSMKGLPPMTESAMAAMANKNQGGGIMDKLLPTLKDAMKYTPMGMAANAFGSSGMMDKLLPAIKDMAKLTPIGMAADAVSSLMDDKSEDQNTASMSDEHLENLTEEMKMLNTRVLELLKHTRDTADYARQNVDATKDLNGNLFS